MAKVPVFFLGLLLCLVLAPTSAAQIRNRNGWRFRREKPSKARPLVVPGQYAAPKRIPAPQGATIKVAPQEAASVAPKPIAKKKDPWVQLRKTQVLLVKATGLVRSLRDQVSQKDVHLVETARLSHPYPWNADVALRTDALSLLREFDQFLAIPKAAKEVSISEFPADSEGMKREAVARLEATAVIVDEAANKCQSVLNSAEKTKVTTGNDPLLAQDSIAMVHLADPDEIETDVVKMEDDMKKWFEETKEDDKMVKAEEEGKAGEGTKTHPSDADLVNEGPTKVPPGEEIKPKEEKKEKEEKKSEEQKNAATEKAKPATEEAKPEKSSAVSTKSSILFALLAAAMAIVSSL